MSSIQRLIKHRGHLILRSIGCYWIREWFFEILWIVYTLQSILFPVWSLLNNPTTSPTTLSYASFAISSAAAVLTLVLLFVDKCIRIKRAPFDKILTALIQVTAICQVVFKMILYNSSVTERDFLFICIVEVVFVSYFLNEKFSSKVPACLTALSFIIYGLVSDLTGSNSPSKVLVAHYFVGSALLVVLILKPLGDIILTGSLVRRLTLNEQKRVWEDHLEGLPDLILIIDQHKKYIYGNKAYLDLCNVEGFPPESLKLLSRMNKQRFVEDNPELKAWLKDKLTNSSETEGVHTLKTFDLYRTMQSQVSHRLTWNQTLGSSMQTEQYSRKGSRKKSKYDTYALNVDLEKLIKVLSKNLDDYNKIIKDRVLVLYGKMAGHDHSRSYEIKVKVSKEGENKVLFLLLSETTHRDKVNKYQEINGFKNQLLGSFSHELRTPLNSNLNFLQAALTHPGITKQAQEKVIDPALKSSQLLTYLVSDILDYSQLALKNLTLNFSRQGLNQELEDAIKIFKTQSHEKQTKVYLKIEQTVPLEIKTDFPRLKRVIVNLLKISLINTFQGEITVEVTGHPNCQDVFKISVRDTVTYTEEQKEQIKNILKSNIMKGRKTGNTEDVHQNYLSLQLAATVARLLSPPKYGGIRFENLPKGSWYYFYVEDVDDDADHRDVNFSEPDMIDNEYSRRPTQAASGPQRQFSRAFTQRQVHHADDGNPESMEQRPLHGENVEGTEGDLLRRVEITLKDLEFESPLSNRHHFPNQGPATVLRGVLRKDEQAHEITEGDEELLANKKCECRMVLVVDDDPFNVLSLGLLIQSYGLKYEEAYNGKLAEEKIYRKKKCCKNCNLYSIIFMDCNMPVQDGYQTALQIKKQMRSKSEDDHEDESETEKTLPYIPIVACTAYIMDFQATKCKEIGMDEYLTKPIEKKLLFRILKQYNVLKPHQRYE